MQYEKWRKKPSPLATAPQAAACRSRWVAAHCPREQQLTAQGGRRHTNRGSSEPHLLGARCKPSLQALGYLAMRGSWLVRIGLPRVDLSAQACYADDARKPIRAGLLHGRRAHNVWRLPCPLRRSWMRSANCVHVLRIQCGGAHVGSPFPRDFLVGFSPLFFHFFS